MTIIPKHHLCIGVLCISVLPITQCTGPTENSTPDLIVATLRSVPDVPAPVQTEDNKDHPGFIRIMHYCDQVISIRNVLFSLTSDLIDPEWNGYNWEWQKFHSDGESVIIFSASWGDTIYYQATFHGPAYSHIHDSYVLSDLFSGWMHRQSGDGMFDFGPDYGLVWSTNNGFVGFGATTWNGISIDALETGGVLYVGSRSTSAVVFEASWDGFGHGSSIYGDW